MFDSLLQNVSAETTQISFLQFIFQLLFSTLLGSIVAFHHTILFKPDLKKSRLVIAKAQVLLCIVGCILVIVIGNNMARAFAIFGIGSFFRLRTPVKNMMDSALMFFSLVLGMVIGLGLFAHAALASAFIYLIVTIMNMVNPTNLRDKQSKKQAEQAEREPVAMTDNEMKN